MTETQERFLRAIIERIPPAGIVEMHLFPPMRQSGVETGVAVVAAELDVPVEALADTLAEPPATDGPAVDAPAAEDAAGAEAHAETPVALPGDVDDESPGDAPEEQRADEPAIEPAGGASAPRRHTVFSARYRLTLKGPDRGKWAVEVVAEADAPLVTVDAVVRGVQRRAGETSEPERISGDAIRALASEAAWPTPATR